MPKKPANLHLMILADNDPIFPNDDFLEEPKTKLKNKKSNKIKPLADLPPLHYRIPKAEAKTPFAEVNQQSPVAFNLLDYKTANQQIPPSQHQSSFK